MHAATLLLIILMLSPVVSLIPLGGLAAVLVMISWDMSEIKRFRRLFQAPAGDIAVLLTTFFLTIFIDLSVAVAIGMILAAFLFIRRMSELSKVVPMTSLMKEDEEEIEDPDAISNKTIPALVEVYEIDGPFFFGVADSLQNLLFQLEKPPKVFILRMRKVPVIDASGLHALNEFYDRCMKRDTQLILSGVRRELYNSIQQYGIEKKIGQKNIVSHIDAALRRAEDLLKSV